MIIGTALLSISLVFSPVQSQVAEAAGVQVAVGAGQSGEAVGAVPVAVTPRAHTVPVSEAGTLNQPDTEYVLQGNIVADDTAFRITASRVTLNLNGFEIVYGQSTSQRSHGVAVTGHNLEDVRIVNGRITQGAAGTADDRSKTGWAPVSFPNGVNGLEIAGLTVVYRTPDTNGIDVPWGKNGEIHHNTVEDQGTTVINRHQALGAIKANRAPGMRIHHNLIQRTRQGGIDIGNDTEVFENHIVIDSHSTNSIGIGAYKVSGFAIYHNTIHGSGEHPIGIGIVAGASDGEVFGNKVEVQNTRLGTEYGASGAACFRTTWGTTNVEVFDNHFTVHAQADLLGPGQDSWGRGIWAAIKKGQKMVFRNNTIVALNNDGRGKAAGIAVVGFNESPDLVFQENLVVSNWGNVLLGDDYGDAQGYPQFVRNVFQRQDQHPDYRTIISDYRGYGSTGLFVENAFENGASPELVELMFDSGKTKDVRFGWQVALHVTSVGAPVPGASVRVTDNAGREVFRGQTAADGTLSANLPAYALTNAKSHPQADRITPAYLGSHGNRIDLNPFTIEVSAGGARWQETLEISESRILEVAL